MKIGTLLKGATWYLSVFSHLPFNSSEIRHRGLVFSVFFSFFFYFVTSSTKNTILTSYYYYYYYYYSLSPLCMVFTFIYLKQTMFLGNIALQLFC